MDIMEAQDEFMGSNDLTQIVKGKRTKRRGSSSSPYKVMTSTSSSGCGGGGGVLIEEYGSTSSPTTSSEVCERTEEEEDMANCLILLAQGDNRRPKQNHENKVGKFSAGKISDMPAPTINKAGSLVYECKTCNRSFPSFQALGGHRASHKKPRTTVLGERKGLAVASMEDLDDCQFNKGSPYPSLSLQIPPTNHSNVNKGFQANKAKVHECSICGSEFMSGQALGGHMRRHRTTTGAANQASMVSADSASATTEYSTLYADHHHPIKPRNILALDLNLPAPPEDDQHPRESKFQFSSAQQALVFSSPTLVDCHY
uniref:C2H2-type domain-containing protein n=1 Tax=Salix viminalis TaxID=40686 RepID=A0A6N2KS05_SALVM